MHGKTTGARLTVEETPTVGLIDLDGGKVPVTYRDPSYAALRERLFRAQREAQASPEKSAVERMQDAVFLDFVDHVDGIKMDAAFLLTMRSEVAIGLTKLLGMAGEVVSPGESPGSSLALPQIPVPQPA